MEDLVCFVLLPRQMAKKYKVDLEETKRYIKSIVGLMKENEEFYELYFLMLEENSELVEIKGEQGEHRCLKRKIEDEDSRGLWVWF